MVGVQIKHGHESVVLAKTKFRSDPLLPCAREVHTHTHTHDSGSGTARAFCELTTLRPLPNKTVRVGTLGRCKLYSRALRIVNPGKIPMPRLALATPKSASLAWGVSLLFFGWHNLRFLSWGLWSTTLAAMYRASRGHNVSWLNIAVKNFGPKSVPDCTGFSSAGLLRPNVSKSEASHKKAKPCATSRV